MNYHNHVEKSSSDVTRAAGIIALATLTSRILGFVRDSVIAWALGARAAADAFFVAFRIPNLLREMFAEGSMSAGFIPVFTDYLTTRSRLEARELARATFTILLSLLTLAALLGILASPWLVRVIAPGFVDEPGKFALTVNLTRLMFPFLLFVGLAALAMGVLNSLRAFTAPAFASALFNVAVIASVFLIAPLFAEPVFGLAVGVVIGGAAQFVSQIPSLQRQGMSLGLQWQPGHPGMRRIGRLLGPVLLGLSVADLNILINTLIASFLAEGSVTYLYYSMRLIQFPLGLFGASLGAALLPTLAADAALYMTGTTTSLDRLRATTAYGLRLVGFLIVPAMIGLIALRVPIIEVLFEHGAFDRAATVGTARALVFYAVGLWAFAAVRVVVPAFYALHDTRAPVKAAVVSMAVNIVLNLVLMGPLGHGGLALATAVASMVNLGLLLRPLTGRVGSLEGRPLVRAVGRAVVAALPVAALSIVVASLPLWASAGATGTKAVILAISIAASAAGYLLAQRAMGSEEARLVLDLVRRRTRLSS